MLTRLKRRLDSSCVEEAKHLQDFIEEDEKPKGVTGKEVFMFQMLSLTEVIYRTSYWRATDSLSRKFQRHVGGLHVKGRGRSLTREFEGYGNLSSSILAGIFVYLCILRNISKFLNEMDTCFLEIC